MAIYGIVIPSNRHCCSQPLQETVGTLREVFVWYVTDTSAKLEDKASTERHMQGGGGEGGTGINEKRVPTSKRGDVYSHQQQGKSEEFDCNL